MPSNPSNLRNTSPSVYWRHKLRLHSTMPLIKKIQLGSFNGLLATSLYVTLSSTFCSNTDILIRSTNSPFVSQVAIFFISVCTALTVLQIWMILWYLIHKIITEKKKPPVQYWFLEQLWMALLEMFMKMVLCFTVTDDLSWVFLQQSKVSCSRAKPTRLSFPFLWIHVQNETEGNKGWWFDWASCINQTHCHTHMSLFCVFDFVVTVLSVFFNHTTATS